MKKSKNKLLNNLPIRLILQTYNNWRDDRTMRLGAGIAYYGVFAIVPMITLMVVVAAYFYSTQDIKIFISDALTRIMGNDLSIAINQIIEKAVSSDVKSTVTGTSIIGLIALFFSASFIFVAFQDALDVIWHNSVRLGFRKWVKRYLWAYIVVLLASTLLFAAILINSVGSFLSSIFPGQFLIVDFIENATITIATWVVGTFVLSLIYKLLIYQKVKWRVLLLGSSITAILIYVGTWLLGLYISNYASSSLSGALGAVLLLLLWVYYEAQIALIGAQLIKTLHYSADKLPTKLHSKK
jgi:membrane protein